MLLTMNCRQGNGCCPACCGCCPCTILAQFLLLHELGRQSLASELCTASWVEYFAQKHSTLLFSLPAVDIA